ncbi:MAG: GNAT family N-acetyltransferase [Christensenellaceae bacterium]|nr:GNAT family N-acetyltransferase [Christensenellaceae bacterium]
MKHLGTKTLESQRLILRAFERSDAEAMFKNWAGDEEVTRFLSWPAHQSVRASEAVLGAWVSRYGDERAYQWAIVPKELGEPIGSIAAVKVKDEIAAVEIGYCIGRNWWRQGIASEALAALLRFFFEEVGVNRVEARHDLQNPNSGKVMQKCGMRLEGTLRQGGRNNRGIVDTALYARLAEEYFKGPE